MFEINNLSKQYGTEFALQNVTMQIGKGMNFIVGSSGSGKTTLLKILCGMEQGFEGSVTYLGKEISTFSQKEKSTLYHQVFGFVWQDFHLLEEATVLENMLLPEYLQKESSQNAAERILKQLGLEELRDKKVRFLSGGQKQRVAIARELMKNPQVIFCDEPTSALDAKSAKNVMDILRILAVKKTVIVVTHDTSLIHKNDTVFELDKGELILAPQPSAERKPNPKDLKTPVLAIKNAMKLAVTNLKNKPGRFCTSVLSLLLAGTLLLTTAGGAVEQSGQSEIDQLVETYGEGILDISVISSFMSAAGAGGEQDDQPDGSVTQDIGGLYEKYQNDERVEFVASAQAFENIEVTMDQTTYKVEKTGNTPVLTRMVSGNIPAGEQYQVVLPLKFAESIGLTAESAIGKEIDFQATIFQWVDNSPLEKPVQIHAVVCGVADNTVVYDYEGQPFSFTVDDSFFFNRAAIEEVRRQAGIEDENANFTIRAKTPEDLISLKDELNKSGIVPLGRFELVEDIVRLNQQTAEQSGSATVVLAVLAVFLVAIIFVMTSVLRKREFAIYKVSGYANSHLAGVMAAETVLHAGAAILVLFIASPVLDAAVGAMFGASILSAGKLTVGAFLILGVALLSFAAGLPAVLTASVSSMLKEGDRS